MKSQERNEDRPLHGAQPDRSLERWLAAKAQRLAPMAVRRCAVPDAAAYGAARSAGVAAGWWT